MDIQHVLGFGFLVLGLVSVSTYNDRLAVLRLPFSYKELKPMQERWGVVAGTILHVVEYVVAPLGFGLLFLSGMIF